MATASAKTRPAAAVRSMPAVAACTAALVACSRMELAEALAAMPAETELGVGTGDGEQQWRKRSASAAARRSSSPKPPAACARRAEPAFAELGRPLSVRGTPSVCTVQCAGRRRPERFLFTPSDCAAALWAAVAAAAAALAASAAVAALCRSSFLSLYLSCSSCSPVFPAASSSP